MNKLNLTELPEVIVSEMTESAKFDGLVREGKLCRLGDHLYSKNLNDPPEVVIQRNIWTILDKLVPGALIADRTAIEGRPAADGSIFVISDAQKEIVLPGHTIRSRKGHPPLESDNQFHGSLFISSTARAYLESIKQFRQSSGQISSTFSIQELKNQVESIYKSSGEGALNMLRNEAYRVAQSLDLMDEFYKLSAIIGEMFGIRRGIPAKSAGSSGESFDSDRVDIFRILFDALQDLCPVDRTFCGTGNTANDTLTFFEAYFTNYIEGIDFIVSDAKRIIFDKYIPPDRPKDAHDILGTWDIVSDTDEMSKLPKSFDDLVRILKDRHYGIMSSRPDMRPGEFKTMQNRAGATVFVAPELVLGTLEEGFKLYQLLEQPFARAVFMKFLISMVHPFVDGNGRVSRIMMNAELVVANQVRIIVPTVFRNKYLGVLHALTHRQEPQPLIESMNYLQKWVHSIPWGDLDDTISILESCNAFVDLQDPGETDTSPANRRKLKFPV